MRAFYSHFPLLCAFWLALVWPVRGETSLVPFTQAQFNASGEIFSSAPLANGQIVIAGNFDRVNGVRQPYVARLNADGTLDQSWRPVTNNQDASIRQQVLGDELY